MTSRKLIEQLWEARTVSKDELAARAEGPFQAVKRISRRGDSAGPILAKIDALAQKVGNFCQYQPSIARFARQNPDNLAAMLIFVLASQGTTWHNLVDWLPMLMDHLKKTNRLYPYPENTPWKAMVYRSGRAIDEVWQNRRSYFNRVDKAKDDLDVFAALLTVPGLSLPKAGFAAQLLVGKFGCLDSINQYLFGVPLDLMTVDNDNQPSFVSMKSFMKDGELTPEGRRKLELYVQFLDSIKFASTDSISQQLWDTWCNIVAGKIWHAAIPRGNLDVKMGQHRTIVPTYPDTRVAQTGDLAPHSMAANLDQEHKLLAKTPSARRGALIGKQHRELITGESLAVQARRAVEALLAT